MPLWKSGLLSLALALGAVWPASAQDASTLPYQNSGAKAAAPELNAGANSFAEGQARALIESKGYSQVSTLTNDSDGIWRGTARQNDRTVEVSVDFKGHVAAQ